MTGPRQKSLHRLGDYMDNLSSLSPLRDLMGIYAKSGLPLAKRDKGRVNCRHQGGKRVEEEGEK